MTYGTGREWRHTVNRRLSSWMCGKVPRYLRGSFECGGSLGSRAKEYCNGLDEWVRGHEDWSLEGERYFGNKCPEIQQNRGMLLLPKEYTTEIGADHVDSSLL